MDHSAFYDAEGELWNRGSRARTNHRLAKALTRNAYSEHILVVFADLNKLFID